MVELLRLSLLCRFNPYLDQILCDRLVCGLRNDTTQRSLLGEADLTLAKAIDLAQEREGAECNEKLFKNLEVVYLRK